VWAENADSSIMWLLPAFDYQKHPNDPTSQLVDTFRRYLDTDRWLPSDKARGQPISTGSSEKQPRDQGRLELQVLGHEVIRKWFTKWFMCAFS
jgi:hypothetical protein